MSKKASRVAVIGLDCALPAMVRKYVDEGVMPHTKKLVDGGFFADQCLCPFPTITPPNWATIATGAWPGTHGITCYHYQLEGTNPDNSNIRQAWSSELWEVESMWEAADKAGKKSIVMTFPGAWPSKIKNGVVVGGDGFVPGDHRHGERGLDTFFEYAQDFVVTTEFLPYAVRAKSAPAEDWKNLPDGMGRDDLLEMPFLVSDWGTRYPLAATRWWLLISCNADKEYDTVTLCTDKDWNTALCSLKDKEWSARITHKLGLADNTEHDVFFRCKLLSLSPDAEEIRFLVGAMVSAEGGWCSKPEYAPAILKGAACLHRSAGTYMYSAKVIDFETFIEMCEETTRFLIEAVTGMMEAMPDWEVFFMHSHPVDWFYHMGISMMDGSDPDQAKLGWAAHKRIYEAEDRLIGAVMQAAGKNTLFAVVSDHGAVADGPHFNSQQVLIDAGLTVMAEEKPDAGNVNSADAATAAHLARVLGHAASHVDYSKSKAVVQREAYVYINLKGRYAQGIVDPKDYEAVQQEIIDALLSYHDPKMRNMRPVALALTRRDAALLGLHGDKIGDVVYAVNPQWGAQHGNILPTAKMGSGQLQSVLILSGPGIKKGVVMSKPCRLVDLIPTLCFASGFPYPAGAEGAVLYQALVDPNDNEKQLARLGSSLESMEVALQRSLREPGAKHDCA